MPNAIPDKQELVDRIRKNIPEELLTQPIWLAYYFKENKNGTLTKPPCAQQGHTVSDGSPGVSFDEAIKDGYPGIKVNEHTNLIAFDIDDKEAKLGKRKFDVMNLSGRFRKFVVEQDSYMEYSPSGCGLRILMTCDDKSDLPGRVNLLKELCIGGELFINSGYVTITGDQISGDGIKPVTRYNLKEWYTPKKADVIDIPIESFKYPELPLVQEALRLCKLDQSERVQEAYKAVTGQDYNHYDYWIKIMAACHHYATLTNQMNKLTSAIVEWSRTDENSFESDDDVIHHWASFDSEDGVTYQTLFKFAKLLKFAWPDEVYDKNGPTGKPMVNSPANFKYFVEYFGVEFHKDVFGEYFYIKAGKDILDKYFLGYPGVSMYFGMAGPFSSGQLEAALWEFTNANGYLNVAKGVIAQLLSSYLLLYTIRTNMFKLWLETDADELPPDLVEKNTDISKSNLDYLLSCITLADSQDVEMVKTFFNTLFFELTMPVYNPDRILSQRSFMLILTGPEACRKTTFWSMLFPPKLRSHFVTNSTETLGGAKSIRDFSASLVSSALVVVDEFEIFYNKKNDSLFKALVTSDTIDYVPIYEKSAVKEPKNAVLVGTTNKRSLPFEQDSNRRLALVQVKWIDTDAMRAINWHYFYKKYVAEGEIAMRNGVHPWKLDGKILQKQYRENEMFRSQSNLEIVMREVFDFDMQIHDIPVNYDNGNIQVNNELLKINEIRGAIQQRYPEINPKPAELKHLLKRLCGKYSDTVNQRKALKTCKNAYIEDGIIKQTQYTRYSMPPQIIDSF